MSTTLDEKVAKRFALSENPKDPENKRGLIFYYFIPKPVYKYGLDFQSNQTSHDLCKELGLPNYEREFFPEQKEVVVKGALFPHFILGVLDIERQCFIINSHFLNQREEFYPFIPYQGLMIDQERFDLDIKNTKYSGYVTRLNGTGEYLDTFHI